MRSLAIIPYVVSRFRQARVAVLFPMPSLIESRPTIAGEHRVDLLISRDPILITTRTTLADLASIPAKQVLMALPLLSRSLQLR
jgi:hypothetical protein